MYGNGPGPDHELNVTVLNTSASVGGKKVVCIDAYQDGGGGGGGGCYGVWAQI